MTSGRAEAEALAEEEVVVVLAAEAASVAARDQA